MVFILKRKSYPVQWLLFHTDSTQLRDVGCLEGRIRIWIVYIFAAIASPP